MTRRSTPLLFSLIGLLLFAALTGCRSSEQIQASPPRPAVTPDPDAEPPPPRTPLTVVLDASETRLPDGVSSLRLRIPEIHFQHETGAWHTRRSQGGTFTFEEEAAGVRTLVATSMPLGSYRALRIPVDNVYVEFGENAGGPLTAAPAVRDSLDFGFEITQDSAVTLRLNFDAAESLQRDEDCRWSFSPMFRADTSLVAPVEADDPS